MNHIRKRSAVVLLVVMSLAPWLSATSGASAVPASPVFPTETFAGGGCCGIRIDVNVQIFEGGYTSNGQLGNGAYYIDQIRGAAQFTRSDGIALTGIFFPYACGEGTTCGTARLSGPGDIATAEIEITFSLSGHPYGQYPLAFLMRDTVTLRRRLGYAMVDSNGTVSTFGGVEHLGDAHTSRATDVKLTPSHNGYWIVNAAGQVFAFGDAVQYGSVNSTTLSPGERVTSMSATPTGRGYWLFTSIGRAITFGDAQFFGDLLATPLTGAIVGSVATPTGHGYYMVGSDGGVFAFGDAHFRGSMGASKLNRPVVGLNPTPDNRGYWLVAADGGVFSFDAKFYGSMGGTRLDRPVVTMVPSGPAYVMIASDGGVFTFAHAPFFGSKGAAPLVAPIVNGASAG